MVPESENCLHKKFSSSLVEVLDFDEDFHFFGTQSYNFGQYCAVGTEVYHGLKQSFKGKVQDAIYQYRGKVAVHRSVAYEASE